MNKEQLQIVQRSFVAFNWPNDQGGWPTIEIEGDYITIGSGLLWISEVTIDLVPDVEGSTCKIKGFKLEISKLRPGGPGEPDDYDLHFVAEERNFPAIVIRAIGCYAEHKAHGIMDDLATEAAVKQYDEWHEELL